MTKNNLDLRRSKPCLRFSFSCLFFVSKDSLYRFYLYNNSMQSTEIPVFAVLAPIRDTNVVLNIFVNWF